MSLKPVDGFMTRRELLTYIHRFFPCGQEAGNALKYAGKADRGGRSFEAVRGKTRRTEF